MRLDLVLPNEGDYMIQALNAGPNSRQWAARACGLSDHMLGTAEDHLHQHAWTEIMVAMAVNQLGSIAPIGAVSR
jgi:hypothetical protein